MSNNELVPNMVVKITDPSHRFYGGNARIVNKSNYGRYYCEVYPNTYEFLDRVQFCVEGIDGKEQESKVRNLLPMRKA